VRSAPTGRSRPDSRKRAGDGLSNAISAARLGLRKTRALAARLIAHVTDGLSELNVTGACQHFTEHLSTTTGALSASSMKVTNT
jgi:hypothetical protein